MVFFYKLLSDSQSLDEYTVTLDINTLEVVKKASSLTNHFKKTAA